MVWPLRNDLDLRGRKVGIGVHRHALKRQDSPNCDEPGQHQYEEPLPQRRLDYSVNHSGAVEIILARVWSAFQIAFRLTLQRVRKLQEQAAIPDDLVTSF